MEIDQTPSIGDQGALGSQERQTQKHKAIEETTRMPSFLRRPSRSAPRIASIMAMLAGLLNLFSVFIPERRERLHALHSIVPINVASGAFVVTAGAGVGLVLLAGGLRRRSRYAWFIALLLLLGSSIAHVVKNFGITPAVVEAFMGGYLFGQSSEFRARATARSGLSVVYPAVLVVLVTLVYGFIGLSVHHHNIHTPVSLADRFSDTVAMAVGLGSEYHFAGRFGRYFAPSVAAIFYGGAVYVAFRALAPVVNRRRPEPISSGEAKASRDSLGWFATRDDRSVVRTRRAAIAYGTPGTVALASGDPFGDPEDWPEVILAFLYEATNHGRVPAVIGCSENAAVAYRNAGLIVRYLGDEAILDLNDFSVDGKGMKIARQSWNRAKRAGYSATIVRSKDLARDVQDQLQELSNEWRGGADERGFSMALGRLFEERDADALFCIGWDGDNKVAGFLHLVPWGSDGASLDIMRRRPDGPGIFNDFLVVESALALPELGVHRLSLNFSFLRALLVGDTSDGRSHLVARFEKAVLRKLSGPFQIESLYRFNKKFGPQWQPRFFAMEALEDTPRILFAALRAEGLIAMPRLGRSHGESQQ